MTTHKRVDVYVQRPDGSEFLALDDLGFSSSDGSHFRFDGFICHMNRPGQRLFAQNMEIGRIEMKYDGLCDWGFDLDG